MSNTDETSAEEEIEKGPFVPPDAGTCGLPPGVKKRRAKPMARRR